MVIFILLFASEIHLKALVFKWLISEEEHDIYFNLSIYIQLIVANKTYQNRSTVIGSFISLFKL